MTQHRPSQPLDVVWDDVITAFQKGQRLGGAVQTQSGARAAAEVQFRMERVASIRSSR